MFKKVIMVGAAILLLLSVQASFFTAAGSQPAIELDGADIEAAAYIDGRTVYLPLRAVGEALGCQVLWRGEDQTISVSGQGKDITIDLNNRKITAGDHDYYMGGSYRIIEDKTYMSEDFFFDNLGLKVRWDRPNEIIKLTRVMENAIFITTVKEASETDKIKITLQYPQVEGLADQNVQDAINAILEKSALEAREEGLKNVDELMKDMASGHPVSPNKYETYFDYRVKYNQNGLLSAVFMDYQYTGGAHGLTVQSSRTFNLETGAEYRLADLFASDAGYVPFINNTIRTEIDERAREGLLYELTPFETIREDHDFYLSNDAVVIYFQQYEYWPYAAGIQEFPVGFETLREMLKPDFSSLSGDFQDSVI